MTCREGPRSSVKDSNDMSAAFHEIATHSSQGTLRPLGSTGRQLTSAACSRRRKKKETGVRHTGQKRSAGPRHNVEAIEPARESIGHWSYLAGLYVQIRFD